MSQSFFSISFELILTDQELPYDLFINSSAIESREKFIKIVRRGDSISKDDLSQYRTKYRQLYVWEEHRQTYLKSLVKIQDENPAPLNAQGKVTRVTEFDVKKTTIIKQSAIHHLEHLFQGDLNNTEVLSKSVEGCRDVVENLIDVLQKYDIDRLQELIASLSFHDFYTYDHSVNVSMYGIMIFQSLYPQATRLDVLQAGMGGLLHDIGKIKIPTNIINNTGKLSDEDFKVIQKHPDFGRELICQKDLHLPQGIDAALLGRVVCEHHENYDGTGYPRKIAKDEIHEIARITAIADFFDAITTKRSYQDPLSIDDAIVLMKKFEGKKIDPKLFELFVLSTEKLRKKHTVNIEFSEDFDPCQPRSSLPIVPTPHPVSVGGPENFGQVKVIENKTPEKSSYGKVKVLEDELSEEPLSSKSKAPFFPKNKK